MKLFKKKSKEEVAHTNQWPERKPRFQFVKLEERIAPKPNKCHGNDCH